jgi:hypothetical protein
MTNHRRRPAAKRNLTTTFRSKLRGLIGGESSADTGAGTGAGNDG